MNIVFTATAWEQYTERQGEEREFLQGCRHLGSLRNQWSFFCACRPVSIMLHAAKPRKEVFMIGEDGARYEENVS